MSATTNNPAVRAYLANLSELLSDVPGRELVVDGIRQHIADSLGTGTADADRVRAVLDELGDPAVIAEDARRDADPQPAPFLQRQSGGRLIVLVLTLGSILIPVLGWIVGLGLLTSSTGWTRRDKTLGVLLQVGIAVLLTLISSVLPGAQHLGLILGWVAGSAVTAWFLLIRFRPKTYV